MSPTFEAISARARRMGLKVKADRYVGGVPVHDEHSRYHVIDRNGHGIIRYADLQLSDVDRALDLLEVTGRGSGGNP